MNHDEQVNDDPTPIQGETGAQRRARYARWAREDPDPYYRMEYRWLAMTGRQRWARWWWVNGPAVAVIGGLSLVIGLIVLTIEVTR
jgi:PAS domain-containing protein